MQHPHTTRYGVAVSGVRTDAPHGPAADRMHLIIGRTSSGEPIYAIAGGAPNATLERLKSSRGSLFELVDELTERAAGEDRDLTDEEFEQIKGWRAEVDKIDERITEVAEIESRREAASTADQTPENERTRKVQSVKEPRTYRENGPHSFFRDAFRATKMADFGAQDRLRAHQNEVEIEGETRGLGRDDEGTERRDIGTGNIGSLVIPTYLVDEFAAVLRNGRAFINACRSLPLPDEGMTIIIPRGNTGTAVAAQATQNSGVQETDADFNNDLTVNVRTFAGMQDVSRQSLERGTPGVDRLFYADLVADYAAKVDSSAIADDGTSGKHKGVLSASGTNSVTYTDGTPTVPEAWSKLADARRQVGKNRKLPANLWVMTTTRWGWFTAALDGSNRPLIIDDPARAMNAMGETVAANFGESQLVGTLMGLPVLCDDNIPANLGGGTNEDRILCVRKEDSIISETGDGMPRELRFEDVGSGTLTVRLLVYGYSAFTAERFPQAKSIIAGTGLAAPTF